MNVISRETDRGGLTVRRCVTSDRQAWDACVAASPEATLCHRFDWMIVIKEVWGHANYSLVAESDGRVRGVLPLFLIRSRLFGTRLVSTPNAVYGGPVATDERTKCRLVEAALDLGRELKADFVELRDSRGWEGGPWRIEPRRQDLYVTFECELPECDEDLMAAFPRDVRRMIRLGGRAGLTVEAGGARLLEDFYGIYSSSLHRLGTPVFPRRLFRSFLSRFGPDCEILVVSHEGRPAGAVMSFYFRGTVLPYFGGADPFYYGSGVSNFMYFELMKRAAKRGCGRFDFGRSKTGTGAFEFKRGWGMKARPLPYRFFSIGGGRIPDLNPLNPRFSLMIEMWKRLPAGVARLAGPLVVRKLL